MTLIGVAGGRLGTSLRRGRSLTSDSSGPNGSCN